MTYRQMLIAKYIKLQEKRQKIMSLANSTRSIFRETSIGVINIVSVRNRYMDKQI